MNSSHIRHPAPASSSTSSRLPATGVQTGVSATATVPAAAAAQQQYLQPRQQYQQPAVENGRVRANDDKMITTLLPPSI